MNLLCESGLEMQNFMQSQEWEFCFIGGLAVIRWGEIRLCELKEEPEIMDRLNNLLAI
jgi:hypothetical protein